MVETSSKFILIFKFECNLGVCLGSSSNIKDFTVPLSAWVCVCVCQGSAEAQIFRQSQSWRRRGRFSTGVNLGCSTRSCLPAFSRSLALFLSLSPSFFPLFHALHISITPGPLLSPSESVASLRGGSKVLIGTMLANGGRLEVACWCELMLSPHPLLAWSGRNKRKEVMAGGWRTKNKNKMKCHWVREALSACLYWCFSHK